jgi:hypothetical protein
MAGSENLLRASGGGAAHELAYPAIAHHDLREEHLVAGEPRELYPSSDPAVGMLEGSLALQPASQQPADHDQQQTVAGFAVPVPARQRIALWSIRYVLGLAGVDAFIGGIAAALPASLSDSLYAYQAVLLLPVIGLLFWPSAIEVSRGYRRARIGVGSDEFRTVLQAGSIMVVACALPAGFLVIQNEALSPDVASPLFALFSALVVGAPTAVVLSLMVRLFARKLQRRMQTQGRITRHLVVAGSSAAALQLIERIQREPHAGMQIVGLCLPLRSCHDRSLAGYRFWTTPIKWPIWYARSAATRSG